MDRNPGSNSRRFVPFLQPLTVTVRDADSQSPFERDKYLATYISEEELWERYQELEAYLNRMLFSDEDKDAPAPLTNNVALEPDCQNIANVDAAVPAYSIQQFHPAQLCHPVRPGPAHVDFQTLDPHPPKIPHSATLDSVSTTIGQNHRTPNEGAFPILNQGQLNPNPVLPFPAPKNPSPSTPPLDFSKITLKKPDDLESKLANPHPETEIAKPDSSQPPSSDPNNFQPDATSIYSEPKISTTPPRRSIWDKNYSSCNASSGISQSLFTPSFLQGSNPISNNSTKNSSNTLVGENDNSRKVQGNIPTPAGIPESFFSPDLLQGSSPIPEYSKQNNSNTLVGDNNNSMKVQTDTHIPAGISESGDILQGSSPVSENSKQNNSNTFSWVNNEINPPTSAGICETYDLSEFVKIDNTNSKKSKKPKKSNTLGKGKASKKNKETIEESVSLTWENTNINISEKIIDTVTSDIAVTDTDSDFIQVCNANSKNSKRKKAQTMGQARVSRPNLETNAQLFSEDSKKGSFQHQLQVKPKVPVPSLTRSTITSSVSPDPPTPVTITLAPELKKKKKSKGTLNGQTINHRAKQSEPSPKTSPKPSPKQTPKTSPDCYSTMPNISAAKQKKGLFNWIKVALSPLVPELGLHTMFAPEYDVSEELIPGSAISTTIPESSASLSKPCSCRSKSKKSKKKSKKCRKCQGK